MNESFYVSLSSFEDPLTCLNRPE